MANYWEVQLIWGAGGQELMNTLFYRDKQDLIPGESDAEAVAQMVKDRVWDDSNPLEACLRKITPSAATLKRICVKMFDNNFLPFFDKYTVLPVEEAGGFFGNDAAPQFYVPVSFNLRPGSILNKAPKRSYIAWGPLPLDMCNFDSGYLDPADVPLMLANLAALTKPLDWLSNIIEPVRLRRAPVTGWIGWGAASGITLNDTLIKERKSRRPEA